VSARPVASLILILGTAGAWAAPTAAVEVQRARYLMGTICSVVADAGDTATAGRALGRGLDEIAALEKIMSSWRSDSEVARLNTTSSMWFPCSPELYAVLDSSMAFANMTGGAFDPTIEPLNKIWDMRGKGHLPTPFEAERAFTLVGWRKLSLDPATKRAFFAFTGMGVDLGGIGKGFALDRAARRLREAGVNRALFNFGGEVLAVGEGWEVTVADPTQRLKPAVRLVVSNAAVSTSAQSERGIVVKKKHYGHIFDPRTGYPMVAEGSVTVVAPSATRADALSTGLLVMGRDAAATFADKHPEIGVLWLENIDGAVQIWKWNLSKLVADSDTAVEWMN
jgi:thiamine biosynthesis lipoprotein